MENKQGKIETTPERLDPIRIFAESHVCKNWTSLLTCMYKTEKLFGAIGSETLYPCNISELMLLSQ